MRVTARAAPIRHAAALEDFVLPHTSDIIRAIRTLADY